MLLGVGAAAAPACDGAAAGAPPGHADPGARAVEEATAERIVREYFQALAAGALAEARNLLAAGPRSDASDEELAADAGALLDLELHAVRVVDRADARILVEVELAPSRGGAAPTSVTRRWLELVHDRRGWRIARLDDVPIEAAPWSVIVVWAQVSILDAEMALEVPHGWLRRGPAWSWSDPGGQGGDVSLEWSTATAGWTPASELPGGVAVMRSTPLELGWGHGTEYVVRTAGVPADAVAEIHLVARAHEGGRVVRLVAKPARPAGIGPFRSVLRRMARSVELHDPSSLTTRAPAQPQRR